MVCAIVKHIRRNIESAVTDVKIVTDLVLEIFFGPEEPFEYDKPMTPEGDVY